MFHSWWTYKLSLPLPCERNTVALHGGAVNPSHWWATVKRGHSFPVITVFPQTVSSILWDGNLTKFPQNRKVL